MVSPSKRVHILIFLAALACGAPANEPSSHAETPGSSVGSPTATTLRGPSETVPPASDDPNYQVYPPDAPGPAQPIRGDLGASILGPQNVPIQQQNPDIIAPPTTDHGSVCALVISI